MPVLDTMATTRLAASASPAPVIAIPGTKRPSSRRSACNPATHISAYLVRDKNTEVLNSISVALKRKARVMGVTLKGHHSSIVDVEFLQTPSTSPVHVLGSCDRDGVVYLWFLYVAVDALGIDVGLTLLKKYSFFTLRRSTTAFYSRIRIAGSVESGTMVLVPNDGANVRVVNFQCQMAHPDGQGIALVSASESRPALPAPPLSQLPTEPISRDAPDADQTRELSLLAQSSRSATDASSGVLPPRNGPVVDDDVADVRDGHGGATTMLATGVPVTQMEGALDPVAIHYDASPSPAAYADEREYDAEDEHPDERVADQHDGHVEDDQADQADRHADAEDELDDGEEDDEEDAHHVHVPPGNLTAMSRAGILPHAADSSLVVEGEGLRNGHGAEYP